MSLPPLLCRGFAGHAGRALVACAATLALALALGASEAEAAPCCGDQSGLGARLGRDEGLSFVGSISFAERIGGYATTGEYASLGPGSEERRLRLEQVLTLRAGSRLELGLRLPEVVGFRSLSGERETGGGLGDPGAFARVTLLPVDDTWVAPAVFASLSVRVPIGKPPWLASGLSTDVTGQGAGEIGLAVSADKTWGGRWFASVGLGLGLFTAVERDGERVERGPRGTLLAATGPVFSLDALRTLACGVGVAYDGDVPTEGGVGRRRVALTAPFAVDLTARVSLVGELRCDLPFSGAGLGDVAEVTSTLGVRFGARAWDL